MAQVPSGTRFIGIATSADLVERKSAVLNAQTQPFTIEDIASSVGSSQTLQQTVDLGNSFTDGSGITTLRGGGFIDIEDLTGNNSTTISYDSLYIYNGSNSARLKNNLGTGNREISLPNASGTLALNTQLPTVAGNYANDAAAAAGGVLVGNMYHTSGVVKIRLA